MLLTDKQLAALSALFRHASEDATGALSRWLGRPARVAIEEVEQVPLAAATEVLGQTEGPICWCAMAIEGPLTGELILAFDDAAGLALADLLLDRPIGTAIAWGEVEISAALETANIIGCAFLNAFARAIPASAAGDGGLLPSPPRFSRDFAEAVVEFALMDQAAASDSVFLTRTAFHIEHAPADCNLLFIPDAHSLPVLTELLAP